MPLDSEKAKQQRGFRQLLRKWTRRGATLLGIMLVVGVCWEQFMRWQTDKCTRPPVRCCALENEMCMSYDVGSAHQPWYSKRVLAWRARHHGEVSQSESRNLPLPSPMTEVGRGYSDPISTPRGSVQIAEELHELLRTIAAPIPYILVGHSLGGHHVRLFAEQYPDLVAGLVLVDAPHGDEPRFPPNPGHPVHYPPSIAEPAFRFAAFTGIARLVAGSKGRINARQPQTIRGLIDEAKGMALSFEQVNSTSDLDDRPLVVITAKRPGDFPYMLSESERMDLQNRLSNLSTNSTHIIAEKSGHNVPDDEPEIVVDAIQNMLEAVNANSRQ